MKKEIVIAIEPRFDPRQKGPRLREEAKTMQAMVERYCQDLHHTPKGQLCPDCQSFLEYSLMRLGRCPYGEEKPVCQKCKTHCYKPEPRQLAKDVMKYAGPKIMSTHPWLVIKHFWWSWTKKAPERVRNTAKKPAGPKTPDKT